MAKGEQLDLIEFGYRLVTENDLDPVYTLLWEAKLDRITLSRWLIAYWCFYHCGTACWIAEYPKFWKGLEIAAKDAIHPRSSERRHFRGDNARKSVLSLLGLRLTAHDLVAWLSTYPKPPTLSTVMERVSTISGFGPWIGFKIADMLERLGLCPVRFSPEDIFRLFDSPREGAKLAYERYARGGDSASPFVWTYDYLADNPQLGSLRAPPRGERRLGIQEIETILCKWKSHLGGHYTVGKDKLEIRHGLARYAQLDLAQKLIAAGVKGSLWDA